MEAKRFGPAVEPVLDFPWAIAAAPDVWLIHGDAHSKDTKLVSITNGGRRGNESTQQKEGENTARRNDVEVCNSIDLTIDEGEDQNEKVLPQTGRPFKKSVEVVQVKPHKKTAEVNEVKPKTVKITEVKPSKTFKITEVKPSKADEITEVKPSKKSVEVLEVKSLTTAKIFEVKPSKKSVEITELKPSKKSVEDLEVKSLTTATIFEMKPSKKTVEITELKPSKKTVEIVEVKPSKKTVEITEVKPSKKTVEITEVKPSKKTDEITEVKPSKKTVEITEVKPSKKTVEVLKILQHKDSDNRDRNKYDDKECSFFKSRKDDQDHVNCNENEMETVEDLFKKYIPEEYLDFLDSSLSLDSCYEFYNVDGGKNVSLEEVVSESVPLVVSEKPQNDLNHSTKIQKYVQSNSCAVDSNTEPKIDLTSKPDTDSITIEHRTSCPPVSSVQTSSLTSKKTTVLPYDDLTEIVDEQPKRYSLRQRKNKGITIYDDTDAWYDQLDFIDEEVADTIKTKNVNVQKQKNHNLRKNENNYGKRKDHNGQSVVQQRCILTDTAKESTMYKYIPRKRKSVQSYDCVTCHMTFKSEGDLEMHKAMKSCDGMYQCVVCGDILSSIENLCIHGNIHNVFFCSICGRCYKTKTGLYRHQYDHTGYKPFSCNKCPSTYKTRNELAIHGMYHTGNMPFHCHKCSKGFPTLGQMKRHFPMHAADTDQETTFEPLKFHECKICGNIFNSQELLQSHEHVHNDMPEALDEVSVNNGPPNYDNNLEFALDKLDVENCANFQSSSAFMHQSEQCADNSQSQTFGVIKSEEYGDNFQLKISGVHQLEEQEDTFQSQKCDINQSRKHGDNSQSQISGIGQTEKHGENVSHEKSYYKCRQCGEVSKSHMAYLYHKLIHNRDAIKKSHKCDKCPMVFHLETSLVSHQLIHREPRPTVCDVCGETFTNQLDLVYHRALHTSEKPLKCSQCPKVFQFRKQLERHTEIHSADRKLYPCETCSRIFKTRSGLARHMMDHTGERRFSCQMCTKKFKTSTQLRCHVAIHTGIRPYSCKICGKSYPIKSYLTSHSLIHK